MSARWMMACLAGMPVLTLTAAYAWLAYDHGTPRMLDVTVHENGRYTLAETILYFRHFLRELPVAVSYAAASAAAMASYGPRCTAAPARAVRGGTLVGAMLLVGVAWAAVAHGSGADVAWHEVLQSYLHDDDPPVPGAHWRYHLLSTVAYLAVAVGVATALQRLVDGYVRLPRANARTRGLGTLVALLIGLTLTCGLTAEPLCDARYLGHQAREAATHLVITLPLSFALLLAGGGWQSHPTEHAIAHRQAPDVVVAAVVGGLVLTYLAIATAVSGSVHAVAPHVRLSSLVAAHCYEHSLDYVLIGLLTPVLAPRVWLGEAPGAG